MVTTKQHLHKRSIMNFYLLLFFITIPFYGLSVLTENTTKILPMNLSLGSLAIICPITLAIVLIYRESGKNGVTDLIKRSFTPKGIEDKIWLLPIFLLMPVILYLSYIVMSALGMFLPDLRITIIDIIVLFVLYFIAATFEEMGFLGYIVDPMLDKWSALKASIIQGLLWDLWHIFLYFEDGHSIEWIFWQCLFSLGARIVIIWFYVNNNKSVLAGIFFHTMINVSDTIFPINGSYYDPFYPAVIIGIICIIIILVYGSATLQVNKIRKKRV